MKSIGEVARLIGRSVDTIKRWERDGLVTAKRDHLNRRVFTKEQIERCLELETLSELAQTTSTPLTKLAENA
jgi:DNA-binding transcriptional MerR regulator